MKTTTIKISLTLLLAICSQISYAQCGQNIIVEASRTDFLDTSGKVTRIQEKPVDVTLQDSVLTIQFGDNQDQILTGKITKSTCAWRTPFRDGQMVLTGVLRNSAGIQQTATLTFTSNTGKTILLYTCLERPNIRIRVSADKFEEFKP